MGSELRFSICSPTHHRLRCQLSPPDHCQVEQLRSECLEETDEASPATILNWSFPRADVTRELQSKQLALALHEEVVDLEKAGIQAIQVDEPLSVREYVNHTRLTCEDRLTVCFSCLFVVLTGTNTPPGPLIPSGSHPSNGWTPMQYSSGVEEQHEVSQDVSTVRMRQLDWSWCPRYPLSSCPCR